MGARRPGRPRGAGRAGRGRRSGAARRRSGQHARSDGLPPRQRRRHRGAGRGGRSGGRARASCSSPRSPRASRGCRPTASPSATPRKSCRPAGSTGRSSARRRSTARATARSSSCSRPRAGAWCRCRRRAAPRSSMSTTWRGCCWRWSRQRRDVSTTHFRARRRPRGRLEPCRAGQGDRRGGRPARLGARRCPRAVDGRGRLARWRAARAQGQADARPGRLHVHPDWVSRPDKAPPAELWRAEIATPRRPGRHRRLVPRAGLALGRAQPLERGVEQRVGERARRAGRGRSAGESRAERRSGRAPTSRSASARIAPSATARGEQRAAGLAAAHDEAVAEHLGELAVVLRGGDQRRRAAAGGRGEGRGDPVQLAAQRARAAKPMPASLGAGLAPSRKASIATAWALGQWR